jgi:monoamine oxidase
MPLDMGCEWLHSGDRNVWTGIAEQSGFAVDRRTAGWNSQYRDLGFTPAEREAAYSEFASWGERLGTSPPASDCAADALAPEGKWTAYLQALSGYISGDELERISARDYAAYDNASTDNNWRLEAGYGTLIAASFPAGVELRLETRVEAITLHERRVVLRTASGEIRPRAVILTVPTSMLVSSAIDLPSALDPWREAASFLPLGRDEKLFLEITGPSPFAPESHVIGDPRDAMTGSFNIRPYGRNVIGCFLGGAGARAAETAGEKAAFARAIDQLAALFGNAVRSCLHPLLASDWAGTASIGGAYSHALPGHAGMRRVLARPFDNRLFFAGEATHDTDFSTAHGAYESGLRAADEAIAALTAQA